MKRSKNAKTLASVLAILLTVVVSFLMLFVIFKVIPSKMAAMEAEVQRQQEAAAAAYAEAAKATPVPVQNVDTLDIEDEESVEEEVPEDESEPEPIYITPSVSAPPTATDTEPSDLKSGGTIAVKSALATTYLVQDNPLYNNQAAMAVDGNQSTSWQEGDKGDGVGQQLQLWFESRANVKYIALNLGNWRSASDYAENNRPSSVTISFGGDSYTFSFSDQMVTHYICFDDPINAAAMTLTINGVYTGKSKDCCISEVTFYAAA